jgi:hypothetical protein
MPVISLSQVEALPDALTGDHYNFYLGTLPGAGDSTSLMIKCLDCVIPGVSNEPVEVQLSAHVRKFRGRKMFPRILTATFLEDITLDTLTKLRNWDQQIVGTNSATSVGNIAQYAVQPTLQVFDQKGSLTDSIQFVNLFLFDIQDINLSSESSQAVRVTAQFSYDYPIYNGVTIR